MLVLTGLAIALGVLVVLFTITKLIRGVRREDEFGHRRRRRFSRRARSKPSLVVGPPAQDPANGNAVSPGLPTSALERIAAYADQASAAPVPSRRSVSVKRSRQSRAENGRRDERPSVAEQQAHNDPDPGRGGNDYARLGEQVTAVLTSAERAAAEIRELANRDAENIRREAEEEAAASRAEVETLRADAKAYREGTRAAADAYAEQTRLKADAQAEEARAALEAQATAVQAEAQRKARDIETEAIRRREVLEQGSAHLEERISEMLTTFRGMTSDLAGLLPTARQREDSEPQDAADLAVDDSLEDALKPERAV